MKLINQEGVIIAKMDETVRGNFRQLLCVQGAIIDSRWQTKTFLGVTKTKTIRIRKLSTFGGERESFNPVTANNRTK